MTHYQGTMQAGETRVVTRPSSFIFTLFGDFVHRDSEGSEELSAVALIRLMALFGLSEQAVRQAVSRMSRQRWLRSARRGARSYYRLTPQGRRRIETISPRIYGPVVEWDGRWRMLTYGVSESNREGRDRIRKDLTVLGWAPLSSSTWISPNGELEAARAAAQAAGISSGIDLFAAEHRGPRSDRELLERCWNLPEIAQRYRAFIDAYRPRVRKERFRSALGDDAAFAERMWLVHDFRKFTYLDPGFPSTLLPPHWPGTAATAVFRQYYAALAKAANRFFTQAGAG